MQSTRRQPVSSASLLPHSPNQPARTDSTSPRPLTFALPPSSITPEKRIYLATAASPASGSDSFLIRLSRRISQSGATLKRKVSKGQKAPIRRASETDKENRSSARLEHAGRTDFGNPEHEAQFGDDSRERERPRKATLKRALRVSVIGRSRSEGAQGSAPGRRPRPTESEKVEELVAADSERPVTEDRSEVSSHRGSYFYSNSLGVCWDGRERVHPDAFLFKPYSSDADVLPSPVIATDRVVYASTLSSFPPRPPLRPRTPPLPTPASLIAAEYRALHPKTPSVYSFSDFDTPPADTSLDSTMPPLDASSPSSPPQPPLEPLLTRHDDLQQRYSSSSVRSSSASSRPSHGEPLTPALSEDSSTSLESLAHDTPRGARRDVFDDHFDNDDDEDDERERHARRSVEEVEASRMLALPRFALVDSGPIPHLHPKPSLVFSEAPSTIDTWRDCEE